VIYLENHIEDKTKKVAIVNEIIIWLKASVLAVLIVFIFMMAGFSNVLVQGISMEPTLHGGDRLLLFNLNYEPKNGDIIVFKPSNEDSELYVKRVIASPGQKVNVDFDSNMIYVDDKLLVDKFSLDSSQMISDIKFPVIVPEESYFVLGDNRDNSTDSRDSRVGFANKDQIEGKALLRMWPLNKIELF